jgi:predicted GIY-YIG superfamily endonuclease
MRSEGGLRPLIRLSYGVTKSAFRYVNEIAKKIMYYIYSLKCSDGYYVGCTDNLKDRIERHQKGNVPATAKRLPVKIDFYLAINDKYKAFRFEKYLKSGSGRAFINKHFV